MLGEVGVLILIYEDISEELLIVAADVGVVAQQYVHIVEDIVEVHGVGCPTAFAIGLVDDAEHGTLAAAIFFGIFSLVHLGGDHRILGIGDARCHTRGFILLVVDIERFDDLLDQR